MSPPDEVEERAEEDRPEEREAIPNQQLEELICDVPHDPEDDQDEAPAARRRNAEDQAAKIAVLDTRQTNDTRR